jgi:NAD(P)-dependent dehydrogenase (short-subunit alcohol dehydrogenase family)
MAMQSFVGKHVLLTGAASGIGRATALELARRGARLELVDIDGAGVEATVASVREGGGNARAHLVDMGSAEAVDALAARVPTVDVVVNNAGVAVVAPFANTGPSDWEWLLGVNLLGPLRLTRALLPAMIERRSGHIVMVASLAGLIGAPGMTAYSATKFAVVGLAEALRLEVAHLGVGVTVVCPGYVRTNFHRATRYDNEGFRRFLDHPPFWYGMKGERVACALADAVETGQPMVVLGPEKIGWWLKRLAPEAAFNVTRWIARRTVDAGGTA